MNLFNSLRTLTLAIILSIGIGYAYAAWAPPSTAPTGGNAEAPLNTGSATQLKAGGLGINGLLDVVGDVTVSGNVQTPTLCLSGDCKSAWPAGFSGSIDWGDINSATIPTGLNDGDDVGAAPSSQIYQCPVISNTISCGGFTKVSNCQGQITTSSSCTTYYCMPPGPCGSCGTSSLSCGAVIGRIVAP